MSFKFVKAIGTGVLLLAATAIPANAEANTTTVGSSSQPPHITKGDAQAVFEAAGTGGQMLMRHDKDSPGAPNPDPLRASIRPIASSPWDGAHFCQEDWHVILQGDVEGGDKPFTKQRRATNHGRYPNRPYPGWQTARDHSDSDQALYQSGISRIPGSLLVR